MKIPFHPIPRTDESQRGYYWRLAAGNGFPSPASFLNTLRNQYGPDIDLSDVVAFNFADRAEKIGFLEARCSQRYILHSVFRGCLACAQDNNYHRAIWDYAFLPHCLKHSRSLVDLGNSLTELFDASRETFPTSANRAGPLDHDTLAIEHSLASELGFSFPGDIPRPAITQGLGANQLQKLVLLFGSHFGYRDHVKPQKVPFKSSIATSVDLVSRAATILCDWPASLERELTAWVGHAKETRSVRRTIGYLYQAVHKELVGSAYSTVRSDFDEALSSIWTEPIINQKSRLASRDVRRVDLETGTEFAHREKVTLDSVIAKIDSGEILGSVNVLKSGRRQVTLIAHQFFPEVAKNRPAPLCLKEAVSRLQLPPGCVRQLLVRGYLEGKKDTGTNLWEIESLAVEELLKRLRIALPQAVEERKKLSLDQVARYYLPKSVSLADVVCALIDQDLGYSLITNSGEETTKAIRIGGNALKEWVVGKEPLSIPEFAKQLVVNQQTAYDLVRRGFVETVDMERYGKVIPATSVVNFKRSYVLAKDLLSKTPFNRTRDLITALRGRGIEPVSGPDTDGARSYLYSVEDVYGWMD